MKAKVFITLKSGVLDPQGKAVMGSLASLGYDEVRELRVGKFIEIDIKADSAEKAKARITEMSEKLLANTVVEDFTIELDSADEGGCCK
jgi:phosphoribosylformylglycinamidine synthase